MSFESSRYQDPPDDGGGGGGGGSGHPGGPSSATGSSSSSSEDDDEPLASLSSECAGAGGGPCFPRPPEFGVPPPPLPPSLCSASPGRRGVPVPPDELQFCEVRPIGAELTTTSAFPSLPVIAVCSSVVLVAVLVASFLLWKHKKKVQNFLPCKSQHQGPCDLSSANGGAYSDILLNHHHPTRLPNHLAHGTDTHTLTPIELLDVKYGSYGAPHLTPLTQTNYTFRPTVRPQDHQQRPPGTTLHGQHTGRRSAPSTSQRTHHHHHKPNSRTGTTSSRRSHRASSEQFNPIYEEVTGRSKPRRGGYRHHDSEDSEVDEDARSLGSEDEFAEDELSLGEYPRPPESGSSSLQGSTGGDLCPPDASSHHQDRPPSRRHRGATSSKHSHSLERNRDSSSGLQAKHNYYLSKSALAFDQRNPTAPYSSVDLVQQPSPPPEPAPLGSLATTGVFNGAGFSLPGASGFMMGPDCQYPPAPTNPASFSTFLLPPSAQDGVINDEEDPAASENIYASIDDEDGGSAMPYAVGGVKGAGGHGARAGLTPGSVGGQLGSTALQGRTVAGQDAAPSYGDIRPVFPGSTDKGRTLCT